MTKRPAPPLILIFDSGVGGLSVFAKIRAHIPSARIVYAADNAAFPYGTKSEEEVTGRVCAVVPAIVRGIRPDLVVLACNTASTVALEPLRAVLSIPVVGVVPAVKPAAELSRSRVIGLLGTPGTVRRIYTKELIDRFASDCTVIRHGSAELVEIAERKLQGRAAGPDEVRSIVDALRNNPRGEEMDVVVMACTHFPLLADELAACAPNHIAWIDSGDAIARRVRFLLTEQLSASDSSEDISGHTALFTAADGTVDRLRAPLRILGIRKIGILELATGTIASYPIAATSSI